ncbi:MAG: hypothetical protein IKE75_06360 [Bacilli bacterium]|nr:hypothetical protein [Bacilli bacterium]
MKSLNFKRFFSKIDVNIIVIFIVSIIVMWPFVSCLYVRGHDSFYHYSNIFALVNNVDISHFKFFPDKIVPIIAYDFGWGSGIFYPSFPQYITLYIYEFFHIFGVDNIFTSMKICHFLTLFLSSLFMYILSKKLFKNKTAGLISAIIYMTFPYYYLDIFVRDALSETFLFVFLPILFLGLEYLLEKKYNKFYIYFIIGYVGCINSHLVLSIYITLFVIIYLLLNYKRVFNRETIKKLFISSIYILLFVLPFLVPLIEHTIFGNYTVYADGIMYNKSFFKTTAVNLIDYFSFERPLAWSGDLVFTISFPALLIIIIMALKFKNLAEYKFIYKYFICFILAIIFMLPIFPWKYLPSFFISIQFLWRLNLFLVFFMSVCTGGIIVCLKNKLNNFIIIIVLISSLFMMWSFKPMAIFEQIDVNQIDINEAGAASLQYIPVKSYKKLDFIKNRGNDIIIETGKASISNVKSKTPYLSFDIKTNGAVVEIPRYYFMGYKVTLNNKKIKYVENKNGLIEFKIKDDGKIVVKYEGTVWYKISCCITFLTLFVLIVLFILAKFKVIETKK